ncbi:MAG: hypothetical protein PHQ12_07760 [Chthoniobacteraceae bacterium]|nr:hypothetical protein [Chthoniobacteraceae bacterium]
MMKLREMKLRVERGAILALFLALALTARAQTNLVPNGDFRAADPLQGWRIDFPYAGPYVKNKDYVKVTTEHAPQPGGKCVEIALPPGVAGNEGGKIESAFLPAVPGATYRVEIDCLTWDFSAKTFVEAWIADPAPIPQPDKFRVPAEPGHPPLLTIYRAPLPDPKGRSKTWQTVSREFTLPKARPVGGNDIAPRYLTLKAYTYEGTPNGGKSYFANFRLYKIKDPQ